MKIVNFGEFDFSDFLKAYSKNQLDDLLSNQHDVGSFCFSDFGFWMYRDELVKLVNSL